MLWKKYRNGNGQQFHQYQQNELSPLTSSSLAKGYDSGPPSLKGDQNRNPWVEKMISP